MVFYKIEDNIRCSKTTSVNLIIATMRFGGKNQDKYLSFF